MENVYVMKKIILCVIVFCALAYSASGDIVSTINARAGKHEGKIRFVFESAEAVIKRASVTTSGQQMLIEFPTDFRIISQKDFSSFESAIKDKVLTVTIKEPFEIKVFRLMSPPRLVIDVISSKQTEQTTSAPAPDVNISQKVFVIDPGHGGYDSGITAKDAKEKDIALSLAKEIDSMLTKAGKTILLTRKSDQPLSIRERAVFANAKTPEVFLSIHMSSSDVFVIYTAKFAQAARETITDQYSLSARQKPYLKKSRVLAESLSKALKENFNQKIILREMPVPALNSVAAPAVLIEMPSSKSLAYDQKTRTKLAETIIKGLSYNE